MPVTPQPSRIPAFICPRVYLHTGKTFGQKCYAIYTACPGHFRNQLIPGIELIWYAARSSHEFFFYLSKILIQPLTAIDDYYPQPYFLAIPQRAPIGRKTRSSASHVHRHRSAFSLLAAFRIKSRLVKLSGIAGLLALILVTANPITFILYKLNLPIFFLKQPDAHGFSSCVFPCRHNFPGRGRLDKEKHSVGKLASVAERRYLLYHYMVKLPVS